MIGTKLAGLSEEQSPISPEPCAPIGLKYLNETKFIEDSCKTFSHSCLYVLHKEIQPF